MFRRQLKAHFFVKCWWDVLSTFLENVLHKLTLYLVTYLQLLQQQQLLLLLQTIFGSYCSLSCVPKTWTVANCWSGDILQMCHPAAAAARHWNKTASVCVCPSQLTQYAGKSYILLLFYCLLLHTPFACHFAGKPGLAGCLLNSHPVILILSILTGQTKTLLHTHNGTTGRAKLHYHHPNGFWCISFYTSNALFVTQPTAPKHCYSFY